MAHEKSIMAHEETAALEVLRAACPFVDDSELLKALADAHNDLKVAMIHLQTNHRVASPPHRSQSGHGPTPHRTGSTKGSTDSTRSPRSSGGPPTPRSSGGSTRGSAGGGGGAAGESGEKIIVLATRGGQTLGLKFKTEAKAGGEAYSGDDGLEISEVFYHFYIIFSRRS